MTDLQELEVDVASLTPGEARELGRVSSLVRLTIYNRGDSNYSRALCSFRLESLFITIFECSDPDSFIAGLFLAQIGQSLFPVSAFRPSCPPQTKSIGHRSWYRMHCVIYRCVLLGDTTTWGYNSVEFQS